MTFKGIHLHENGGERTYVFSDIKSLKINTTAVFLFAHNKCLCPPMGRGAHASAQDFLFLRHPSRM